MLIIKVERMQVDWLALTFSHPEIWSSLQKCRNLIFKNAAVYDNSTFFCIVYTFIYQCKKYKHKKIVFHFVKLHVLKQTSLKI